MTTESSDETLWIAEELSGETVCSKVKGGQIFDSRVITEDANVRIGSEAGELVDQFDILSLDEDKVSIMLERKSNSSHNMLIMRDKLFSVLEDSFVVDCIFSLLSYFSHHGSTLCWEQSVCCLS